MDLSEKNVPPEIRKAKHKSITNEPGPEPEDLDWAYIYSNKDLITITKTFKISHFCKIQHYKYIAHVTRLDNNSFQKQILFAREQKKYARNRWLKLENELHMSTMQIQKVMQNKDEFMSLLCHIYK